MPSATVYGFLRHANPTVHDGTWAELITVPEDMFIARRPASVDLATAGAAPLAGITALLSVDALALTEGDTVLVVGATGGVGASPSSSPRTRAPPSSLRPCPRTRSTCAVSA
jgi:NADPH:quinone reductase-like Zn-dependent oxidoreductase